MNKERIFEGMHLPSLRSNCTTNLTL